MLLISDVFGSRIMLNYRSNNNNNNNNSLLSASFILRHLSWKINISVLKTQIQYDYK